jgi:hypothetical protein
MVAACLLSVSGLSRAQELPPLVDYLDTNDKEVVSAECRQLKERVHVLQRERRAFQTLLDYKSKEARLHDELSALRDAIANNTVLDASAFEAAYADTRLLSIYFDIYDNARPVATFLEPPPSNVRGYSAAALRALYPKVRSALEAQLTKILETSSEQLSGLLSHNRAVDEEDRRYYEHFGCEELLRGQALTGVAEEPPGNADSDLDYTKSLHVGGLADTDPDGRTGSSDFATTVIDQLLTPSETPSTPSATAGCAITGDWRQSTVDVGQTTWNISAGGQATETGIGNAKGSATLTGQTLRIDWTTTNGYAGQYQWRLDSDCKSGSGTLVFSAGRTGSYSSIVTR